MPYIVRKVSFFFGLNIWGLGLVRAGGAQTVDQAILTGLLLVVGTLMLSAALLPRPVRPTPRQ